MQWISDSWRWLIAQHVDWDLTLRFIQVLIWPMITLIGLAMVRPGRIVSALLDGGEISAGPATLKFRNRIEAVAAAVDAGDDEETPGVAEPAPAPRPADEDPYTTVMNGWALVTEALETLATDAGLRQHSRLRPMETVEALLNAKLIDRRHQKSIEKLLDYRNSVKNAGSGRVERRGLTQDVADEYYDNAAKARSSILRTVHLRLQHGSNGKSSGPGEPPSPPLN